MSNTTEKTFYTRDEYLELEQTSELKHEFYKGEIFAMSPGVTINHAKIVGNIGAELLSHFKNKKCTAVISDVRIRVEEIDFDAYPDIVVFCEEEPKDDEIRNPALIVEVLSKSTRDYDRGQKFELYRYAPSLKEYIVVDQYQIHIEQFTKNNNEWILKEYRDLKETLSLSTFDMSLPLSEIYRDIKLSTDN